MSKDYYNILGVSKESSQDDIKKAFRKKAHQYHPDKATGDEAKFKEINEAYQVLGDENKRKQYDQFGSAAFNGGGPGGAGGFDWSNVNMDFGDIDLGDVFAQAFGFGGRAKRRSGPQRGEDIHVRLELDFEEAVRGVKKKITLQRLEKCEHCSGSGAEPGTPIKECADCGGKGQTVRAQTTPFGTFQTRTACRTCRGEGKSFEQPCKDCHGQGVLRKSQDLEITIPAGINEGETLRVTGKGDLGLKGGPVGDLYVQILVRPSTKFAREGYDILSKAHIGFPLATLGGKVEVETLDGPVTLKIPSGTQSGTVMNLKGKGVECLNSRGRGNHLVEIIIDTPKNTSRKARKLLEELEKEL